MLHCEPLPVTVTMLLFALPPMRASPATDTLPPAEIVSVFPSPVRPTSKRLALVFAHTELLVTTTELLSDDAELPITPLVPVSVVVRSIVSDVFDTLLPTMTC